MPVGPSHTKPTLRALASSRPASGAPAAGSPLSWATAWRAASHAATANRRKVFFAVSQTGGTKHAISPPDPLGTRPRERRSRRTRAVGLPMGGEHVAYDELGELAARREPPLRLLRHVVGIGVETPHEGSYEPRFV